MRTDPVTPARRRSAPVTRRQQTRITTRRPLAPPPPWCWRLLLLIGWQLQRGIIRPRLVGLTLLLVWSLVLWLGLAHALHVWPAQAATAAPIPRATSARPTPPPVLSIAQRVQALYQGAADIGWDSPAQHDAWWPSACAPAALTEVLRAWGTHVGIGPVLDKLSALQAITPADGLTNANALATVAQSYRSHAKTLWHWTGQQVAQVTRQGVPVLVLLVDAHRQTPYPAFVTGHWLVVVSVSATQIEVRDSSGYRIHTLTPSRFHTLFTGVAVVVWRGALALP